MSKELSSRQMKVVRIDAKKLMNENFTVCVQIDNTWKVKLGLFFIRIGCSISGAKFVNEFPASLLESNGEAVEVRNHGIFS